MPSLFAYAYHDIYDEKNITLFVYEFPRAENLFKRWIIITKNIYSSVLNVLLRPEECDGLTTKTE
jgi:hypothetical protein